MLPSHPLEPVARSLCLPTELAVDVERARLSSLVRMLHPLHGSWSRTIYVLGLLWPFACGELLAAPMACSQSFGFAAVNLVVAWAVLRVATWKNARELFLLEPLPAGVDLYALARGNARANAYLARLKRGRGRELVVDLLALQAYR